MDFWIHVEFDNDAKPLSGTRAMLYKLLDIKPTTIISAPPDPDPKTQSFLGVPPRIQKPEQKPDRRKIPHIFKESSVPCAGGCGRNVKYRGAGIKPKCPTCGGKGIVVEDKPATPEIPPLKKVPEVPEILKTPNPPILNPELPKKVCPDCETPLIIKFSKWFCSTCNTVKDAPKKVNMDKFQ